MNVVSAFLISFIAGLAVVVTVYWIKTRLNPKGGDSPGPDHVPAEPSPRCLEERLETKYGCKFKISDRRRSLSALIGDVLADEVNRRRNNDQNPIRIGVVCGPMVTRAFEHMAGRKRLKKLLSKDDVQFVAMNRAGDADRYRYAANYQVTRFAELFEGSKALACTQNPFDKPMVNDARKKVHILICSAGRLHGDDRSYIAEWYDKLLNQGVVKELPEFPSDCVGDFCLMPIDFHGRVAGDSGFRRLVREHIDPYPRFKSLDRTRENPPTIICPIRTPEPMGNDGRTPPDKERVASAILRSGVVDTCVLEYHLGKNLDRTLGWFVMEEVSEVDKLSHRRMCTVSSLKTRATMDICAFDPHDRLSKICRVNRRRESSPDGCSYPTIIISEYPTEARPRYNRVLGHYEFDFRLDGKAYTFRCAGNARKPGQWSLATYATIRSCVESHRFSGQDGLRVLDLGCGCGVVGILCADSLGEKVGSVLCTDIESDALKYTEINARELRAKVELCNSDLFGGLPENRLFDVIAFNPPFVPANIGAQGLSLDQARDNGRECAKRFCREVCFRLRPGGVAILTISDYASDGSVEALLGEAFANKPDIEDRMVLYPMPPADDKVTPPAPGAGSDRSYAHEAVLHERMELACNYHFEKAKLGDERFIVFGMRHFIAWKSSPTGRADP